MYDKYICSACLRRCGEKKCYHFDNCVLVSLTALISKFIRAKSNMLPDAFRKFHMESREETPSKSDLK